jgi:hypothetical protein
MKMAVKIMEKKEWRKVHRSLNFFSNKYRINSNWVGFFDGNLLIILLIFFGFFGRFLSDCAKLFQLSH